MKNSLFKMPFLVFAVVSAITLFSGYAKYHPHKFLNPIGVVQQNNNIQITAEALTDADCHHYFSRRVLSKGYQAIQICIKNNSDQAYALDARDIGLEIEDRERVARRLHLNTAGRVISWSLPGLFCWPFFVPAIAEGVKSHDANKKLNNDFNQRVLTYNSRITIAPGSSINKVFFVSIENFKDAFDLSLEHKQSGELISFKIRL